MPWSRPATFLATLLSGLALFAGPAAAAPDQRALAKRLVADLAKARTPEARSGALLGVMRSLDIAVGGRWAAGYNSFQSNRNSR